MMPFQIWIQCQKKDVQRVKVLLEKEGQLNKIQKVKPGEQDGEDTIPSIGAPANYDRLHAHSEQYITSPRSRGPGSPT